MPILVDCDWGRKNRDISQEYEVRGYPTVIFTDPKGKVVAKLGDRSPAGVRKAIEDLAKKYRGSTGPKMETQIPYVDAYDAAFAKAKKDGKLLLVFLTDGSKRAVGTESELAKKDLSKLLAEFVVVRHEIERDCKICERHKARSGCAVHVIDPSVQDPYADPLVREIGKRSARSLERALQRALKDHEKSQKDL